jgi:hypothetical protein
MKCARCSRYLSKPAATVTTGDGSLDYGPRCAELMALVPARVPTGRRVARRARRNDGQMKLALEVVP